MGQNKQSVLWRIGGAQGHGIDSASLLFSRVCAKMGFHILGHRDYHSNIMGRHSFSDVRIANWQTLGHVAESNMLVCLDAESLSRHIECISTEGVIIIDADEENVELDTLKFLDVEIKSHLHEELVKHNYPFSVTGLLALIKDKKTSVISVPFSQIRDSLQTRFSVSRSTALRSKNITLVAISAALLNIPKNNLLSEVSFLFKNKEQVIALNRAAIELGYDYVNTLNINSDLKLPELTESKTDYLWLNGCKSIALGKLAAGMGIQPYYPISPATDESLYLETKENNSIVIQTEDELAAITMACGAALTGARVATSTSGPGFSLMAEGLGWAGMNEVPVVVTLYQRGGPSTGLPTRTEQGDLQFSIHAGHGEFPRIVITSGDVTECFYDAFRAFNYVERYQLPVIHIIDKNLASTSQTIKPFNTHDLTIERGQFYEVGNKKHLPRFKFTDNGISPRPRLGEKDKLFWSSGAEHSEIGQVNENPQNRKMMVEKRANKLQLALSEIPLDEKLTVYGNKQASLTIISWGSNKGVIVDALERFKTEGKDVRAIMLKLLWPFPVDELNKLIHKDEKLVVVECNHDGQFNSLLKEQIGRGADHLLLKYTGRAFMLEDIMHYVSDIISGQAEKIISVE